MTDALKPENFDLLVGLKAFVGATSEGVVLALQIDRHTQTGVERRVLRPMLCTASFLQQLEEAIPAIRTQLSGAGELAEGRGHH